MAPVVAVFFVSVFRRGNKLGRTGLRINGIASFARSESTPFAINTTAIARKIGKRVLGSNGAENRFKQISSNLFEDFGRVS
jgi:hypothetical protein